MFTRLLATTLLLAICAPLANGQDGDRRRRRADRERGMDRGFRNGSEENRYSGRRRGFDPISRLDANQNGVIDQSEIDGIPERFRGMMEARGFKLESGESVGTVRDRVRQRFDDERRERDRHDADSSDNGRANRSTPPPAFKPRDRERITVDLPKGYAEVDSDLDGQIGLYEWIVARRNDLELFDEIDGNADGLLTPRELAAWDKLKEGTDTASFNAAKRERLLIVDGGIDSTAEPPKSRGVRDRTRTESDDGKDRGRGRDRGERSFRRRDRD